MRVYADLTRIVEEVVADRLEEGRTLPEPVIAQEYSGKFLLRTGPALHKALAVRAWKEGKSLNQVCLDAIQSGIPVPA